MTDDQLTPTSPISEETPAETAVADQPEEGGVVPSEPIEAPPLDIEVEPLSEPVASLKTDDELLFERALAELDGGEEARRDKGPRLSRGERIEAKVILVEQERVFVDLGTKAEGVVPLAELSELALQSAIGHVKVGDTFQVVVLRPEGSEGGAVVSKKKADFDMIWYSIIECFEEGRIFDAQVVDRVKGGLVVDIGVRGFVPATHVGSGKLRNIEKYVGETLAVKIIEVDRERKKVVLSNKEAMDLAREECKRDIFTNVKPQDVKRGTVRRLTDYGAFIDLGGIDGLLHISEMSWARIDHPREVLKEGDEIDVMVLRLDPDNGRISLGLRQVLPDPWNLIRENYKVGQKIQVKVGRIVQSGAFVKLPEGGEAFLPQTEVSNQRIKKVSDVIEEGQEIEPTIVELKPDERRMVLSLRDNPFEGGYRGGFGRMDDDRRRPLTGARRRGPGGPGGRRRDEPSYDMPNVTTRVPTGGATIGERLGMLKGLKSAIKSGEAEAAAQAQVEAQEAPPAETQPE